MANTRFQLESSAAKLYEQENIPNIGRPTAELTFEHATLHDNDRVLDVACGTGIVVRVAVQRYANIQSIVGVDLNTGMLDVARENTPSSHASVEWRQGDMCALPFPDGSFDVALCQQGVQFVPDKLAALQEIRRVLVSGGRLAFTVWSEAPAWSVALAESLTRHVSADVAKSCLAPFVWNDAETIRKFVSSAGFCNIEMHAFEFMRREGTSVEQFAVSLAWLPFARDVAEVSEETHMAIWKEVSAAMQAYRDGDNFVYPFKSHLVQARKG
jgi:ubiquinone/menaquinone biosynthesis C-methylase UbiE